MPATIIIPARLGSTRLPRKVLADETGAPMIVHVCHAAARSALADRVAVATDHAEIADAVRAAGFECILTSPDHPNGTSRIAEASSLLRLPDDAVLVNVQGDEPEIEAAVIDAAAAGFASGAFDVVTVASPFAAGEPAESPHIVKVVAGVARAGGVRPALYFSRSLVPFPRGDGAGPLKHAGLYAYTAGFVRWYAAQAPTPLERAEQLEQLRALELGRSIGVVERAVRWHGVDTAEDYRAFVARFRGSGGEHAPR